MFCFCGTILEIPTRVEEKVFCTTCDQIFDKSEFKSIINSAAYKEQKESKHVKVKGIKIKYTCSSCGNEEMSYVTMQTRSADEGQTIFYSCECGYKEKLNS